MASRMRVPDGELRPLGAGRNQQDPSGSGVNYGRRISSDLEEGRRGREGDDDVGGTGSTIGARSTTGSIMGARADVEMREETPEERQWRRENERRKVEYMRNTADIPSGERSEKLVACLICSLIKSQDEFEDNGCDNCEQILRLAGQRGSSGLYTSINFSGMIGLMEPTSSWVAEYQHIKTKKRGMYAISVQGTLPYDIRQDVMSSNIGYRNRDKSVSSELARQRLMEEEDGMMRRTATRRVRRKKKKEERKKALEEAAAASSRRERERERERTQSGGRSEESEDDTPPEDTRQQRPKPTLEILHGEIEGQGADIIEDEDAEWLA